MMIKSRTRTSEWGHEKESFILLVICDAYDVKQTWEPITFFSVQDHFEKSDRPSLTCRPFS